ncbi:MAG: nickel pincer cofactor biosynthesis protein LarC [Planctomycetia bacterium]|nr:nickel pincer cofactor biosynthesis protein LarC [Planctomycetia bacterium]
MKEAILYIDASHGVSGDMFLGAFVDLGVPFSLLQNIVASLGISGLTLTRQEVIRGAFRACKVDVQLPHEHAHRHLADILTIIGRSSLSEPAKEQSSAVFQKLAAAEAHVHGKTPDEIHFHEVGAADSIADILCGVAAFEWLKANKGVSQILASPIATGTGTLQMAHGLCSIPAPATAELLKGVPSFGTEIPFELATPTGAVLTTHYATSYGSMPLAVVQTNGVGAGGRDLAEQANVLTLFLMDPVACHAQNSPDDAFSTPHGSQQPLFIDTPNVSKTPLCIVETNLDDCDGELVGFVWERLTALGARDIWTTPIMMKKQRPGFLLGVLCDPENAEQVARLLFEETPAIGLRVRPTDRYELKRSKEIIETNFGPVEGKTVVLPDGKQRFKPEYEELRRIARETGQPLLEIRTSLARK